MKDVGDDGSKIDGPLCGGPSYFRSFSLNLEIVVGSKKICISE